jgi:selenide,water dikinase
VPVHATTDVTGFGLLGHLAEMTRGSKVRARLHAARIPLLPDVVTLADAGLIPGGTRRNLHAVQGTVEWDPSIAESLRFVIGDAQTSGGLLIATPDGAALMKALEAAGVEGAAQIGEILSEDSEGTIEVWP